jgi:hypothetical protein
MNSIDGDAGSDVAYDATVSMLRANIIALSLLPIAYFLFVLPFQWIWTGMYPDRAASLSLPSLWLSIPILLLGIVVHELIHALGFIFVGKVPRKAVKIGIYWKALAPYAHCREPMTAFAYRISVMLPGLLLGVVPGILGVAVGFGWLVLWGAAMTVAAGGDLAVLLAVRSVPGEALVRDHPSQVGGQVLKDRSVA